MSLMSVDCITDVTDLEDEEKEESQEIEDTDIEEENEGNFFQSLICLNDFFTINDNITSIFIIDVLSIYSLDIHLPPPE
jgi:hypothetical protein